MDFIFSLVVILELLLTGLVVALSREWLGTRHGSHVEAQSRSTAYISSLLLLICSAFSVILIVWRLFHSPKEIGSNDELTATAAAISVLWWSDVIRPSTQRRRYLAVLVTCVPTFRFGRCGRDSPTEDVFKDAEFAVRSALWKLRDYVIRNGSREYWRAKVARHLGCEQARDGAGGSLLVLYDVTTQDTAGAELLSPQFINESLLNKEELVHTIWRALLRSAPWNIHKWESNFVHNTVECLAEVPAVRGMKVGELAQNLPDLDRIRGVPPDDDGNGGISREASHELCLTLWAAMTVEVLLYLGTGENMIILPCLANLPVYLASTDVDTSKLKEAFKSFQKARAE